MTDNYNMLFEIFTRGLGVFYVVDTDPTSAGNRLKELLDKADYGFSDNRKIETIKVLTNEVYPFNGRPFFSSLDHRLILPESCKP